MRAGTIWREGGRANGRRVGGGARGRAVQKRHPRFTLYQLALPPASLVTIELFSPPPAPSPTAPNITRLCPFLYSPAPSLITIGHGMLRRYRFRMIIDRDSRPRRPTGLLFLFLLSEPFDSWRGGAMPSKSLAAVGYLR